MSAPQVEAIPLTAPGAGGGAGRPPSGFKINKKQGMWAGALVVVVLGLVAARRAPDSAEVETETALRYELDTTQTDLYNELQPEMENIADAITDLSTKVEAPAPVAPAPAPVINVVAPKPTQGKPINATNKIIVVRQGDTLASLARKHDVRGGGPRLYLENQKLITAAARKAGLKNPKTTRTLVPGTRLVIP